jgi:hypothetical protein
LVAGRVLLDATLFNPSVVPAKTVCYSGRIDAPVFASNKSFVDKKDGVTIWKKSG